MASLKQLNIRAGVSQTGYGSVGYNALEQLTQNFGWDIYRNQPFQSRVFIYHIFDDATVDISLYRIHSDSVDYLGKEKGRDRQL